MITIVVLNDGDAYTGVDGCSICVITPEANAMLEQGSSPKDITPLLEIALKDVSPQ